MSLSAGRVLILPKGEYDSTETYNLLDLVYYQRGSFLCKKTTTGNAPDLTQDTEYWMKIVSSQTADVGDISELTTIDKDNVTAAINEINGMIQNNLYYAQITDDNSDHIVDDSGNRILGDWKYAIA